MPFAWANSAKSAEANWGPLSDAICFGIPWVANRCRNTLTVMAVVVQSLQPTWTMHPPPQGSTYFRNRPAKFSLNGIECSQDCRFCIHVSTLIGLCHRLHFWKSFFYWVTWSNNVLDQTSYNNHTIYNRMSMFACLLQWLVSLVVFFF